MSPKQANVPMNKEIKDRDVDRKLQLYGIYSAFNKGKAPSNKQIDIALNSLLESKPLANPSTRLSSEGRELVQDARDVIINAKQLLLSKNQGNLLQEFIWEAEHIGQPESTQVPGKPVEKEEAKQHGEEALGGFKTLGMLIVTNGQFRKLLRDATLLLRDMAGDTAQKAANRLKPSEDQMAQIDQPAEPNTWHEAPDFNKENIKSQIKSKQDQVKTKGRQDASETAQTTVDTARRSGEMNGVNGIDAKAGARAAKERGAEKIPDEQKKKAKELSEKTKDFLAEKMPQERREQTIWRLKKMLVEIQSHSDYQPAIETLLSLAERYTGHGRDVAKQGTGTAKDAREEMGLKSAETKLKTLIERFANCTSTDDWFDALTELYRDADRDPRLKDWFRSLNTFIRKCLREQGYVLEDSATQRWNELYDEGQFLLRERYRDDVNSIVDETKFLAEQFDEDPLNKAFGNSMTKLFQNIGHDTSGNIVFKRHLMKDVTNIIMPAAFEEIRYIPIPRIEVKDEMVDAVVENLVIESDNLMPNVVEFGSDNYWRFGRKKISSKRDNKMMISATGIQTDWRDVSYYIKKKKGFKIKDKGVMDIIMGGEGFSFRISGSSSIDGDELSFMKPEKVSVSVKDLDIKLKKSKHKILFSIFKPTLFKVVKPAVEKVLEKQIRESFTKGDAFAHRVYTEAHRAQEAAREGPEETRSLYSYYLDAFRSQWAERRRQAEAAKETVQKRDTKVNIAVTQHESLFPDIKLPGGISTKATEYRNLAAQGDRWESPVFSIGSASETTNIPTLAPIRRKPHATRVTSGQGLRYEERGAEETRLRETKPAPDGGPVVSDKWTPGAAGATAGTGAVASSSTGPVSAAGAGAGGKKPEPLSTLSSSKPRTVPGTMQEVF